MANTSKEPGNPESAPPVESRRSPPAGDGGLTPDQTVTKNGEGSVLDVPQMGEFSAEAARPTPLDDIVEAERSKLPSD
jgi:hypothetical protein